MNVLDYQLREALRLGDRLATIVLAQRRFSPGDLRRTEIITMHPTALTAAWQPRHERTSK